MLHVVAVRSRKWRIPRSPPRSRKERNLVSFFLVVDSLHLQLFLANTMTKTLTVCSTYCKIIPTDTESKVRVIDVGEIDASTMMFFFFLCVCAFALFAQEPLSPCPITVTICQIERRSMHSGRMRSTTKTLCQHLAPWFAKHMP